MLTLLQKRKARTNHAAALLKQDQQVADIASSDTIVAVSVKTAFDDKPWDEQQHELSRDIEYARTLAGSQEKTPFKKELVKKYSNIVQRLLSTHDDLDGLDVVWWYYQWQVDVGLLPLVYDDFHAAVQRGLSSPKNWKSNGQTAFCDIIFKYTDAAYKEERPLNAQYLFDAVENIVKGTFAVNVPLKVKVFRLAGDLLVRYGSKEDALVLFEQVMAIDPKGGCKNKIKTIKEELGHE